MNRIIFLLPMLVLLFTVTAQKNFDIEAFNRNRDESDYRYFTDRDGYNVVQYSLTTGFVGLRRKPDDLFEEYRAFYSDGSLKEEKQCLLNKGFIKGKGYFYSPTGMLIEVIDYDLPYSTHGKMFLISSKNTALIYMIPTR